MSVDHVVASDETAGTNVLGSETPHVGHASLPTSARLLPRQAPSARPAADGSGRAHNSEAKELGRYFDQFVTLPRDILPHEGRRWPLRAREIYVLVTLYRMAAREERPFVSCTPKRLARVTGIPLRSLPRMLGVAGGADNESDCVPPRLYPWIKQVSLRDNALGERVWDLLLTPMDDAEAEGFLRVPHWWLWTEGWKPTLDLEGRAWDPDDPGIYAALAISHVGVGHKSSRLGKQGLATVSGVSRATMTRALADAERKGWIRVEGTKGGPGRLGGRGGTGKAGRQAMIRPSVTWARRNAC